MAHVERIVLHVGQRKTGSSSIQGSLHGVDRDGFRYADLEQSNHSRILLALTDQLFDAHSRRLADPDAACSEARRASWRAMIEAAVGTAPARTVLFSAESLERASDADAAAIGAFFQRLAGRLEVVGFVRPPIGSQLSRFQESKKHGNPRAGLPVMGYRRTFEPYIRALGARRVTILPFRPADFVGGSLLRTFLHGIGEPDLDVTETRVNEAMSADATKLLHAFNRLAGIRRIGALHLEARERLWIELAEEIRGEKLVLPDAAHPRYELPDDVAWLRAVSGIDFSAETARMNPDAAAATAIVEAEMNDISAAGITQLLDLVERHTGERPKAVGAALRRLYRWHLEQLRARDGGGPGVQLMHSSGGRA